MALDIAGQQFEVDFAPGTRTSQVAGAFCEEQWELLEPLLAADLAAREEAAAGGSGDEDGGEDEDEEAMLRRADAAGQVELPTREHCVELLTQLADPYVKQAEEALRNKRAREAG